MAHKIGVYINSRRVVTIEGRTPRETWRRAVAVVKARAHAEGATGGLGWFRTRNRDGFECGPYHATQVVAVDNHRPFTRVS